MRGGSESFGFLEISREAQEPGFGEKKDVTLGLGS